MRPASDLQLARSPSSLRSMGRRRYLSPAKLASALETATPEARAALFDELTPRRYADPNDLNQVGLLARGAGRPDVGRAFFAEGIRRVGAHPTLLNNLGLCLLALGEPREAEASFRRAIALDGEDPSARVNLGSALLELLEPEAAEASFEAVLARHPAEPRALLGLALAAQARGEVKLATQRAVAAQRAAPGSKDALRVLVECLRAAGQTADAETLARRGASAFDREPSFLFELGHLLHDRGRYDEARAAFDAAHARLPPSPGAREAFERDRAGLLEALAGLEPSPRPSLDPEGPIFVVGSNRSGTTLVERILAAHPEVQSLGESPLVGQIVDDVRGRAGHPSFAALLKRLREDETLLGFARARARERLAALVSGGGRPLDKLPSNAWRAAFIALVFPGAPIVQLVRDGREVAFSAYTQNFTARPWQASSIEDALFEWSATLELGRASERACPAPRFELRYEELVADFEPRVRALLEAVGLDFHPACLRFHERSDAVRTASRFQIREPIHRRRLGRARLYPELFARMTALAEADLRREGYLDGPLDGRAAPEGHVV